MLDDRNSWLMYNVSFVVVVFFVFVVFFLVQLSCVLSIFFFQWLDKLKAKKKVTQVAVCFYFYM